jgi:hypothetical protein
MSSLSVKSASKKEEASGSTRGSQASSTTADEQEDALAEQEAKPYACEDDACLKSLHFWS